MMATHATAPGPEDTIPLQTSDQSNAVEVSGISGASAAAKKKKRKRKKKKAVAADVSNADVSTEAAVEGSINNDTELETAAKAGKNKLKGMNGVDNHIAQHEHEITKQTNEALTEHMQESLQKSGTPRNQLDNVSKEVESSKEALASTKAELESANTEIKATKTELENARKEAKATKEAHEQTQTELESAKEEVKAIRDAHAQTQAELESANADKVSLQKKLNDSSAQIEILNSEIKQLKDKMSKLELAKGNLEQLAAKIEDSKELSTLGQTQAVAMERELSKIDALKADLENLQRSDEEKQSEIVRLMAQLQTTEADAMRLRNTLVKSQATAEEAEKLLLDASGEESTHDVSIENESRLAKMEAKCAAAIAELAAVKAKRDDFRRQLSNLEQSTTVNGILKGFEQPVVWQLASYCMEPTCKNAFTWIRRRHHCRECGRSVCSTHSTVRRGGVGSVRICTMCLRS